MNQRGSLNERQTSVLLVVATCETDSIRKLPGQTIGYLSTHGYIWRENGTYVLTAKGNEAVARTHRTAR